MLWIASNLEIKQDREDISQISLHATMGQTIPRHLDKRKTKNKKLITLINGESTHQLYLSTCHEILKPPYLEV